MSKNPRRKFSLTLIEVVVALSLTAILLSFLWQTYYHLQKQLLSMEKKKAESLQKLFIQEKISKLFSHIEAESGEKLLYTMKDRSRSHPTLVFKTTLPIDPDPDFSGLVLSGLYLSEQKELCLVHWASKDKLRTEVLLQNIVSCHMLFYDSLKKEWKEEWTEKMQGTPAMIKCKIATKEFQEEYLFFPSQHLGPILYPQKQPS